MSGTASVAVANRHDDALPASASPKELSHRQLVGILGVIAGAAIVTLTGRLLSLGAADLEGGLGLSVDQGAWVGTAFNVAIMFIGPMTVYLGGLLGPRRVLLPACTVFTLVSMTLPFVRSYALLLALLAIAGLSSGTFYPLTLSFALRNAPSRLLAVTLAGYAMAIEGAVNLAPSLYGVYRDRLSWESIFWTSAIATPVMIVAVWYGVPVSARPPGKAPSFAGFLYASAGLALIYAALDQGQRLGWWHSRVFVALFASAAFLLLCSVVRRLRRPNPLVDLPYLRQWNTLILALGIFAFRFVLLATVVIIPQSLAIHGYDAKQFGPAVAWTALAEMALAFAAAKLLNSGLDSRLLMAGGFAAIGVACLMNAELTSAWFAGSYFRSELLMAVGQSFALVGLVSGIVLQAIVSGGLSTPHRALTFSAFFHVVRLFGGQIGVALLVHFLAVRQQLHAYLLGLHVQAGDWVTDETLQRLTAVFVDRSNGLAAAAAGAVAVVDAKVHLQAYTLAFIDAFRLMAWVCVFALLLIALLRKPPLTIGDLARQTSSGAPKEHP